MTEPRKTRRVLLLAGIWLFAIGTYFHLYPNISAVPLDTGFHPQQDWLRHHVAQTGSLSTEVGVKTRMSLLMETRPRNHTSLVLTVLTVLTGQSFPDFLATITLLPLHGLVILPLTALVWYRLYARRTGVTNGYDTLIVLAFSLFPFGILLLKFSSGYRTVTYGAALLGTLGYLVSTRRTWRGWLLTLLVFVHVSNTYHTIVLTLFVFTGGCLGVLFTAVLLPQSKYNLPFGYRGLAVVTSVCLVGAVITAAITGAWAELVANLSRILQSVSLTDGGVVIRTPTFRVSQSVFNENISDFGVNESAKLLGRLAGLGLVAWYAARRIPSVRSQRRLPAFTPDALVVLTLPVFVVYAIGMYAYGGFGQMISRTMFIGVLVMFPMVADLLTRADNRSLARGLVCVIVVTAAIVAVTSPKWDDTEITSQEAGAINFTGTHVPDQKYVVSDMRLGPSLYYVEHPRLVWLTPSALSTPAEKLYGCHSPEERRAAVDSLVSRESFEDPAQFDAAILLTERMRRLGASVWFLREEVCDDFPRGYDRVSRGRVYHSGDGQVFEYTGGEA